MNSLLALLALLVVVGAFGYAVMGRLRAVEDGNLATLLFATALGLGAFSLCMAFVGVCGSFRAQVAFPLLLAVAITVGAMKRADPVLEGYGAWLRGLRTWRPDAVTVALTLAITAFGFLTLTGALAPPTSNEWDSLAYHLAVAKVWLHDLRIHMLPYDNHAGFPMLTEMLYALGLDWGSVSAAKLVHWLYGMLCALACYWAGRHWVSRKAGLLAAALFLASPAVGWEATTAYIDLAAALYVALSVFAFARFVEALGPNPPAPFPDSRASRGGKGESDAARGGTSTQPSPEGRGSRITAGAAVPQSPVGWLWLAGICGGLACGVKMTMVATSGMLVLWAAGLAVRRRVTWGQAGLLAGLMFIIGGPWYVKTWIWTGNPVYPFAYGLFGGKYWGAAQAAQYAAEQARFGIGKTLYGLWVAPWSTAFFAQYYANPPAAFRGALEAASGGGLFPAVFGTVGIGVIGLLPMWLLRPGGKGEGEAGAMNRAPTWFAVYGGAFLLVWFGLTHQTRYLIPILPVLLVPAVAGARAWWHAGSGWRAGVGAFCAVALLWGLLPLYTLVQPCFAVAWGGETQDTYLSRTEPIYNVSKAANAALPANAKILLLNEVRGFYLDRPYQWGDASQNALIRWDTLRTPAELDRVLRSQGISHVLVNWGPAPAASERWPSLAKAAIAEGEWVEIVRLKAFAVYGIGPMKNEK